MYKRISCIFLVLILFVSLTACSFGNVEVDTSTNTTTNTLIDNDTENTHSTNTTTEEGTTATTTDKSSEGTTSTTANSSKDKTTSTTNRTTTKKPTTTTKKSTTTTTTTTKTATTTTTANNVKVEDVPVSKDENTNIEIDTPDIEEEVVVNTKHVELSVDSYYQYSALSSNDKKIYDKLLKAMTSTENVVNIQSYNINYDKALSILQKVLADNPQLFWVSKSTSILYNSSTKIVVSYVLYYTDGEITDAVNQDFTLSATANRTKINNKIIELNNKIEKIVSSIPTDISDFEKEKMIHDYIVSNVSYDTSIASTQFEHGATLSHSFDIYGAVCKGKAVCEGYAKMFQYLCYCVGINATQVIGKSNNQNHMWNTAKIDGQWYQVDVTWNDTNSGNVPYYGFFNITTTEMLKDHTIDTTNANVPSCTATKYSVLSTLALNVTNANAMASNYKEIFDYTIKLNSAYIIIHNKNSIVTQQHIREFFLNPNSTAREYFASKGYTLNCEYKYRTVGEYIYIPISFVKS